MQIDHTTDPEKRVVLFATLNEWLAKRVWEEAAEALEIQKTTRFGQEEGEEKDEYRSYCDNSSDDEDEGSDASSEEDGSGVE